MGWPFRSRGKAPFRVYGPSQAKVDDLDLAAIADQYIRRFEVAVNNASAVRGSEASSGCNDDREPLAPIVFRIIEPCPQRSTFDQLHGDKNAAVVDADVVHDGEVGMDDLGHRLRFADQALLKILRFAVSLDQLDGNVAMKFRITRSIDRAHPAAAQWHAQAIASDPG